MNMENPSKPIHFPLICITEHTLRGKVCSDPGQVFPRDLHYCASAASLGRHLTDKAVWPLQTPLNVRQPMPQMSGAQPCLFLLPAYSDAHHQCVHLFLALDYVLDGSKRLLIPIKSHYYYQS